MKNKQVETENIEQYFPLVDFIIRNKFWFRQSVPDLSYDDLFQVGCIALLKAKERYNENLSVKFTTFAQVVIKNSLIDHYRKVVCYQNKFETTDVTQLSESFSKGQCLDVLDQLSEEHIVELLETLKPHYNGVVRKGIEALQFRVRGYTNKEIAQVYGVKNNYVGAWIAQAVKKLRENQRFLSLIL